MSKKKKPIKADEEWFEPSYLIGVGSYQINPSYPSSRKIADMRIVGFVRPKIKTASRKAAKTKR